MNQIVHSHPVRAVCTALGLSLAACTSFTDGELGIFENRATPDSQEQGPATPPAPERSRLTVTLTASATAVCPGECVELTAAASGGLAPYQYNWDLPVTGAGPHRVCPATSTTYRAYAIDADFEDNGLEVADEVDVALRTDCEEPPPPVADAGAPTAMDAGAPMPPVRKPVEITLEASETAICPGDCIELTASATGGRPPYQFNWDNPDWTGPGPHRVCPQGATSYLATVIDADFETNLMEYGARVQIDLRPYCGGAPATGPLAITLEASDTSICAGECIELTAAASGGAPPYMYSWDPDEFEGPGPHRVCPTRSTQYYAFAVDSEFATNGFEVGAPVRVTVAGNCPR